MVPDVADGDGLRVELEQGHGLVMKHGRAEVGRRRTSWRRRSGSSRRLGRDGSVGGCPLHGGAREGVAGALGRLVPLLGGSRGLLLGFEGASQGGVARGLAFALQALSGGGGLIRLLLGKPPGNLVGLEGGGGAVVVVSGSRRRRAHGGAAQQGPAREGARGWGPARLG